MHARRRHRVATNYLVFGIKTAVVLVTIMRFAVFLGPARLYVQLSPLVVAPLWGPIAFLNLLVVLPTVALPGNRNQRRSHDLSFANREACIINLAEKTSESLIHQAFLPQTLTQYPQGLGVGNRRLR